MSEVTWSEDRRTTSIETLQRRLTDRIEAGGIGTGSLLHQLEGDPLDGTPCCLLGWAMFESLSIEDFAEFQRAIGGRLPATRLVLGIDRATFNLIADCNDRGEKEDQRKALDLLIDAIPR